MTNTEPQDYASWAGHQVVDKAGDKVGKVSAIFLDDESGKPEWVAVSTGLFANKSSFVPLQGSTAGGDQMVVAWDKAKIKDAPQVDDDGDGHLTPAEEEELYRYYGMQSQGRTETMTTGQTGTDTMTTARTGTQTTGVRDDHEGEQGIVGRDTSGPTTDSAMTRSEEQLTVGTTRQEAGRVRLRKYVTTEQVSTTVPVSHEEVRLEREPITDANRGAATSGPDISEEEHEVTLMEERPVVEKEVVPVERVRLAKETVTSQETVSGEVRKEQIVEEGGEETVTKR